MATSTKKSAKASTTSKSPAAKKAAVKTKPVASAAGALKLDQKQAFARVMELMAIPGTSGQEGAVAEYVTKQFRAAGLPASALKFDNANTKTQSRGKWAT